MSSSHCFTQFSQLKNYLSSTIIGQEHLVNRLLITLLADGHLLVEGAPGLAKTRAVKALSDGLDADFHRIQFTPDLLPADVTGTDIYLPEDGSFRFQPGPIFHNLILADEINRAPAKVQSSLLEAMAERQVSVGQKTYPLPEVFMVMATQNPIEQEGTYPLPEAQLDRFIMHVRVGYPDVAAERAILKLAEAMQTPVERPQSPLTQEEILQARQAVLTVHMEPSVEEYIVQLINASRHPERYSDQLSGWLDYGASPRGTIALDRCARAYAWLDGRDYVTPDDVQSIAHDVLRHRLLLTFEAEAEGKDADQIINQLLDVVPIA
ncbi:AAA family ATPase [Endozoicomonas sp. ALE010]|uniref:AAA family ATPase n=1 Tax=Endozoicomonas sp. ALE010 TaxID=3403081 RepID=UPI003BB5EEA4